MARVENSRQSIGTNYPTTTGRLKQVIPTNVTQQTVKRKIALAGDSTLDNNYWVDKDRRYADRTHTVTHQTAVALAHSDTPCAYSIANFAVDGATTAELLDTNGLNIVVSDEDHTEDEVHQLKAIAAWQPDTVVLSVAGNNYREALFRTLKKHLTDRQLLSRNTPAAAKPHIKEAFQKVKATLLEEYKRIIDNLIKGNPNLTRLVLLSQYYPEITEFTPYFIYTGFSHVARAQGNGRHTFTAVEETMNELYREVLQYAASKNKEVVFVDVASSLNPLGGNHTMQIEPNERGAPIMGRLIAKAVEYQFPANRPANSVTMLRMNANETVTEKVVVNEQLKNFSVKPIAQFISESRYRHVGLFFSPSSKLRNRYEYAYHMVMGKQFDSQYTGLFAFGLLDASLVTIAASYLWRVVLHDKPNIVVKVAAGTIAAPILLSKMIVGLAVMLALALPIYALHKFASCFTEKEEKPDVKESTNDYGAIMA